MLSPKDFRRQVISPTLFTMGFSGAAAERLLLGTALAESGLRHLVQIRGPALGLFQIEPATHHDLWHNYLRFRPHLATLAKLFIAPRRPLQEQLVWNMAYATAITRLIYFRDPDPLPAAEDSAGLAAYYKRVFNTALGRGSPKRFAELLDRYDPIPPGKRS
jgi:hypothetical protein